MVLAWSCLYSDPFQPSALVVAAALAAAVDEVSKQGFSFRDG